MEKLDHKDYFAVGKVNYVEVNSNINRIFNGNIYNKNTGEVLQAEDSVKMELIDSIARNISIHPVNEGCRDYYQVSFKSEFNSGTAFPEDIVILHNAMFIIIPGELANILSTGIFNNAIKSIINPPQREENV